MQGKELRMRRSSIPGVCWVTKLRYDGFSHATGAPVVTVLYMSTCYSLKGSWLSRVHIAVTHIMYSVYRILGFVVQCLVTGFGFVIDWRMVRVVVLGEASVKVLASVSRPAGPWTLDNVQNTSAAYSFFLYLCKCFCHIRKSSSQATFRTVDKVARSRVKVLGLLLNQVSRFSVHRAPVWMLHVSVVHSEIATDFIYRKTERAGIRRMCVELWSRNKVMLPYSKQLFLTCCHGDGVATVTFVMTSRYVQHATVIRLNASSSVYIFKYSCICFCSSLLSSYFAFFLLPSIGPSLFLSWILFLLFFTFSFLFLFFSLFLILSIYFLFMSVSWYFWLNHFIASCLYPRDFLPMCPQPSINISSATFYVLNNIRCTALLVGGSRDRSPVVLLGIFSLATDGTMCSGVDSTSKNKYQKNS